MAVIQYDDDLYTKSCSAADLYDNSTLTNIFIQVVGFSKCHSLGKYGAMHPHEVTDIASKAQLLPAIQNNSVKQSFPSIHAAQSKAFALLLWKKSSVNVVEPESYSSPTRNTRRVSSYCRSSLPPVIVVSTTPSMVNIMDISSSYSTLPSLPCQAWTSVLTSGIEHWPVCSFRVWPLPTLQAFLADNATNNGAQLLPSHVLISDPTTMPAGVSPIIDIRCDPLAKTIKFRGPHVSSLLRRKTRSGGNPGGTPC